MTPSRLGPTQLERVFVEAGGPEKFARLMANLAQRESGGRPTINNRGTNKNGTVDWGLWQINDIWRKDPVVGPLFKSGAILTPEGNARAAVHILKVQGPKAWATYQPGTDAKYLGGFQGGAASPSSSSPAAPAPSTPAAPAVDNRAARGQLAVQFLNQHGADPLQFAMGIRALRDVLGTPAAAAQAPRPASPSRQASFTTPPTESGVANFEGKKVAAWIAPALVYARQHGWKGQVNSGFRSFADQTRIYNSGVRPAAKPGTSNHEGTQFPRGAVDVSDAQTLSRILQNSPYGQRLKWAGAKDPVHFSHPHSGSY